VDPRALSLSVLDLASAESGRHAGEALAVTVEFARRSEQLGFRRFWVAEHHLAPSFASAAPAVLIGQIVAATSTIRVGSGGVLVPNHSPLAVVEQFATLDALHPNRIDLGFGRGPGTFDAAVAAELRRGAAPATDADYDRDIRALLSRLTTGVLPGHRIGAEPWALASSTSSAQLAGELGLPLAVAHHIRPQNTLATVSRYRATFRPSRWLDAPRVMVCVVAICADTDEEADELALPYMVLTAGVAAGQTVEMPTPEHARTADFGAEFRRWYAERQQFQGAPSTIRRQASELIAATGADELMILTMIYDLDARTRSLELLKSAITAEPAARSSS
jgi:luciferase family oxidoreductase group 1